MGILADRLDSMVVTVSSPDGRVVGELRKRGELDVSFLGNGCRQYTERGLEHQLNRLLDSLWAEHRRGFDAALAEALGRPVEKPREPWDANQRRFEADQAETAAEGMSERACIFMKTTAMVSWDVVIRDGTLTELDDAEFVEELLSANRALHTDYHTKMARLRVKHYGVDII